jgi:hypothetical protein
MKLPQHSLRELFLLVVIAAMGCGWWVDRFRIERQARLWQANALHWKDSAELCADALRSMDYTIAFGDPPPVP